MVAMENFGTNVFRSGSIAGFQWWRQLKSAKLFLLLYLGQGQSIGGVGLTCSGSNQSDGDHEDGLVLLSHCSNRPLLGDFSGDNSFLFGGSRSRFVLSVEKSLLELPVCQAVAYAYHMEAGRWWLDVVFCCYATPTSWFSRLFRRWQASLAVVLEWVLLGAVRRIYWGLWRG